MDLLAGDDEGRHWVIEHTVVESFAGRIFDNALFNMSPPPSSRFSPNVWRSVCRDRSPLQASIESHWIRAGCRDASISMTSVRPYALGQRRWPTLSQSGVLSQHGHNVAKTVLAPWEVSVWLTRWPGHDGRVLAMRSIPENLIALREERIATALEKNAQSSKRPRATES